jgi:hypothetical protein
LPDVIVEHNHLEEDEDDNLDSGDDQPQEDE